MSNSSKMRWFTDDFDYRVVQDGSPELMRSTEAVSSLASPEKVLMDSNEYWFKDGRVIRKPVHKDVTQELPNIGLPPMVRMLMESNDWYIQVSNDGRVERAVRMRNSESVPWLDPDEMDEEDKQILEHMREDGLIPEESEEEIAPTDKWDLLFWTETKRRGTEYVKVEKSSPVFPLLRDKRLKGYACNLEKAIGNGIGGRSLYKAIQDALGCGDITKSQAARLFEIYKIAKFLNKKGE